MKVTFLAATLVFLLAPCVSAQKNNFVSPDMHLKIRPGLPIRVTLTSFSVAENQKWTPPRLMAIRTMPPDLLQATIDEAKAQHLTPIVTKLGSHDIVPGATTVFDSGSGVGSALSRDQNGNVLDDHQAMFHLQRVFITPRVTRPGIAEVSLTADDVRYTEDDRTHIKTHVIRIPISRLTMTVNTNDHFALPDYLNDRLHQGMLFLSFAPAPPANAKLPANTTPVYISANGISLWTTLDVQITEADVPADKSDAVIAAMNDPVGQQRRLLVLSQDAVQQGQTFIIMHGVRGGCVPRSPNGIEPLDGDKLSTPGVTQKKFIVAVRNSLPPLAGTADKRVKETVTQKLSIAARMLPDETATMDLTFKEDRSSLPGKNGGVATKNGFQFSVKSINFRDGETKVLYGDPRADGIQFLVFTTVTIHPPGK